MSFRIFQPSVFTLCLVFLAANALFADDVDSMGGFRYDYRIADVVVHVEVTEKKLIDQIGDNECENDKGNGYCAYRLKGRIKETFKGNVPSGELEFVTTSDATYPKKYFLGEHIQFLILSEPTDGRKPTLGTIENSTRVVSEESIRKLRLIASGSGSIDETDEEEPYSRLRIKKNFEDADIVVFVDVVSFVRYTEMGISFEPYIATAKVKELFKGNLSKGDFQYIDDLLYRPLRQNDLGPQVLYLKWADISDTYNEIRNGKSRTILRNPRKIRLEKVEYTEGRLIHGLLEKLRLLRDSSVNQ